VIVAPFDDHDVFAPLAHQVTHVVIVPACVLYKDLLTWSFGPVHAHVENIITYNYTILISNFK